MMPTETKGARFVRGLVKTVFIGCYAAFMWASIHHVAAFFDHFEQNGAADTLGSYLLAGAIDITALVTTIGVMFFRKSMPRNIQGILWVFIVGLALYSFFINWEYASHYQQSDLILQPTGQTTPVYDAQGVLHYVPVMRATTWLLSVNPALASCFTIFALIYSVVGEFFGTKAPTIEELKAKEAYLKETAATLESIRELEARGRKPGIIQRAKQSALEIKAAVQEVTHEEESDRESTQESGAHATANPDALPEGIADEAETNSAGKAEECAPNRRGNRDLTPEESLLASAYENTVSWLTDGRPTVPLKVVSETMHLSMKLLRHRVATRQIQATRNKEIVRKDSVIAWAIRELLPKESQKIVSLSARAIRRERPEASEEHRDAQVQG